MDCFVLQEYSPDLHSISKKSKNHHGDGGITLTSIHRSDNTAPQSYNNYSMSNDNTQHAPPPQTQVSNTSRYVRSFVKELQVLAKRDVWILKPTNKSNRRKNWNSKPYLQCQCILFWKLPSTVNILTLVQEGHILLLDTLKFQENIRNTGAFSYLLSILQFCYVENRKIGKLMFHPGKLNLTVLVRTDKLRS